ncbi:hypothetical protein D3C72_1521320 [compost metagenome]
MRLPDRLDDLGQMQLGTVDDCLGTMPFEHRRRYQGAGIDDHRAAMDQALALDGDQLGVAGAGTDEIDGHAKSLRRKRGLSAKCCHCGQRQAGVGTQRAGNAQVGRACELLGQGQSGAFGDAVATAVLVGNG